MALVMQDGTTTDPAETSWWSAVPDYAMTIMGLVNPAMLLTPQVRSAALRTAETVAPGVVAEAEEIASAAGGWLSSLWNSIKNFGLWAVLALVAVAIIFVFK